LILVVLFAVPFTALAQQNRALGELQFAGATKVERDSGVWIDGQYVGYLKELRKDKKIMLLPGDHEIAIRQAGYKDFTKNVILEPGQLQVITARLEKDPRAVYPAANAAELKLNVVPERAAVFVDDGYIGHVSDFGGAFHSMVLSPGQVPPSSPSVALFKDGTLVYALEYEVHGQSFSSGASYDNRFSLGRYDCEQKNLSLERLHGLFGRLDGVE
jgi:hypothetical protein